MTIRDIILQIVSSKFKNSFAILCTIDAVNNDNTADCLPIDGGTKILNCRIQSDMQNGLVLKPTVGSIVAVQMYDDFTGVIVCFSKLDSIQMLDGSFGGLTKTQELKTQLDKTNNVLQAVVDSLKNWTPVPNDGGAALKAYFTTQLGVKVKGDYSAIENNSITHGNP